ncbi:hypothetical protein FHS82_004200 [Pseudochelatococcus lubricantis]|uniref:DUF2924 domain-containing protein n=1 Tax=Pseudochelatococcus lubricantis TaxID=1538102 RepID=A0ABX0V7B0_9HYPH|nr:DUF2924 domain-containing protein [Pseudochelatococcus lubricantis]NIJ60329.1 hypothetical protein [Pseudochelatococcus lubricantis]
MTLVDDVAVMGSADVTSVPHGRSRTVDLRAELPTRLTALGTMDRDALVSEWRRQFRVNPPERIRRDLLELGTAWKLQEKAFGGVKKAVAAELQELAQALATTGDIRRAKAPRLKPGARLVREWGGVTHEVNVTEAGFVWDGKSWKSLSAIAEKITGAHWSGPRFFGLASRAKTAIRSRANLRAVDGEEGSDA